MGTSKTDNEILRQRLYRLFHVYEENYITTVKVLYVYHWLERRSPEPLTLLECIYTDWPTKRQKQKLDDLFRTIQTIELSHLAASPQAITPPSNSYIGIQKW